LIVPLCRILDQAHQLPLRRYATTTHACTETASFAKRTGLFRTHPHLSNNVCAVFHPFDWLHPCAGSWIKPNNSTIAGTQPQLMLALKQRRLQSIRVFVEHIRRLASKSVLSCTFFFALTLAQDPGSSPPTPPSPVRNYNSCLH